jgi:hypothetical protein
MAENYRHLYEQMKRMVEKYQDEIVPGLRKVNEDLMQTRVEVVRCKDCKHEENCMKQLVFWERDHVLEVNVYQYHNLDFCSYGKRRTENAAD